MTSRRTLLSVLTVGLAAVDVATACAGKIATPSRGTIGQPCLLDGTCNMGLTCVSNACVALDAADVAVYSALDDRSKWSTFDTTTVSATATGFQGAAFDGRYLYFVPNSNLGGLDGVVVRYDTQAVFTTAESWSTFDMSTVDAGAKGFLGAAFDGRYVYFVPGGANTLVGRLDTKASFTAGSSWSTFDMTTVNATAKRFAGAVFDGRYVDFLSSDGLAARYDTLGTFTARSSWSTFDVTTVNAAARGFVGGVFDGRYVYFAPSSHSTKTAVVFDALAARYDTQSAFTNGASWSTFDTTTVNADARGFLGAAFDGRYAYFVSLFGKAGVDGVVARYDTHAPFMTMDSWSTFDTATLGPSPGAGLFIGAAFDGRYVYFVPSWNPVGLVARYDTKSAFTASGSWATFDMKTLTTSRFAWAAFDGRYVYFLPLSGGIVARFDAKSPSALPPGFAHGSFF